MGSDKVHTALVVGSVEGVVGRDLDGEALAVAAAVAALGRLLRVRVLHLRSKYNVEKNLHQDIACTDWAEETIFKPHELYCINEQ